MQPWKKFHTSHATCAQNYILTSPCHHHVLPRSIGASAISTMPSKEEERAEVNWPAKCRKSHFLTPYNLLCSLHSSHRPLQLFSTSVLVGGKHCHPRSSAAGQYLMLVERTTCDNGHSSYVCRWVWMLHIVLSCACWWIDGGSPW